VRKPRRDELWDRTPGGVIVPRRPTLPTRRFIQKWGTVQDCCGEETCDPCAVGRANHGATYSTNGIWATFALTDGSCSDCNEFNDSYFLPFVEVGSFTCGGYTYACVAKYGDWFDVSVCGSATPVAIWTMISDTYCYFGVSDELFKCGPLIMGQFLTRPYGDECSASYPLYYTTSPTGSSGRCSGTVVFDWAS
jgi:hypothetical protein